MADAPPELTVQPGYSRPGSLPRGECIITRLDDPVHGARLRIDHADPRILISAELLEAAATSPVDGVSLDESACTRPVNRVGAVLRVEAVNRTIVYRMVEYLPSVRGYIAEWPD